MSEESKEKDNIERIKIGPGDILTFGGIDLLFSLVLTKREIEKYKIKWDKLSSVENLKFLKKHPKLWKRVELSSSNETMKLLLQLNKSSQKIIKIGYVVLQNLIFEGKQKDYRDFFRTVTNENGLFVTCCDACSCTVSIKLKLIYNKQEKIILLAGSASGNDNEEKEDEKEKNEKKEEKKEEKNENEKKDEKKKKKKR